MNEQERIHAAQLLRQYGIDLDWYEEVIPQAHGDPEFQDLLIAERAQLREISKDIAQQLHDDDMRLHDTQMS